MSLRSFIDSEGTEWRVWDVVPEGVPAQDRRRTDTLDPTVPDRRLPVVDPELDGGWLVCESALEKRRIAPIPEGWESCPDAELERLCKRARERPNGKTDAG